MTGRDRPGLGIITIRGPGADRLRIDPPAGADPVPYRIERSEAEPEDTRAARARAMRALRRSLDESETGHRGRAWGLAVDLGVGRVDLALQTPAETVVRSITGPDHASGQDHRDRAEEQVRALLAGDREPPTLSPGWTVREAHADAAGCGHPGLTDLVAGSRASVAFRLDGESPPGPSDDDPGRPTLILPGSFRPFHAGHATMAEVATRVTGRPCGFDLSLFHPDKPPLDFLTIASRLGGFRGVRGRLTLTNTPTFLDKARVFPGSTFVVGHDTATRIIDPRYYGGDVPRDAMLNELKALGTSLLICGRVDASGRFRDVIDDPAVADFLAQHTQTLPESAFRVDLSSTAIRVATGVDPD